MAFLYVMLEFVLPGKVHLATYNIKLEAFVGSMFCLGVSLYITLVLERFSDMCSLVSCILMDGDERR